MAEINLKPQLRFPKFNDNWKKKRFDEIYSFKTTNSYSRDNLNYEKGSVRNIHYGDIHTKFNSLFDITQEDVPFINPDIDITKIADECYLKEADLVIADASENYEDIGKCIEIANLNNERVVAGLHTFLARKESDEMQKRFASFLMKTEKVRLDIKKIAQGTKVLSISTKRLAEISLHIPTPEEQTQIANFLTSVDKRIALLNQKKKLLERYKQGVMQKIFNKEIGFKDENGEVFPEWEGKRLGRIAQIFSGGTPQSSKRDYYGGTIPFIKSGEINSSKTEQLITTKALNESSAKLVVKGDLLLAIYGATSGEVAVSKINGAINQAILCIRGDFNNLFLYNWFTFNKKRILATYLQGGQGNLSAEIIKNLIIELPSIDEQKRISSILNAIDKLIETLTEQSNIMKNWRKGLLQKLFI